MTIGIMGAMEEEIALLRRDLRRVSIQTLGQRDYLSGLLHGREAVLVFSRLGKVAAASTATTLIQRFGVETLLFTGVAGATAADLRRGDVVVASELIQHDMDASAAPGFSRFEIPLLKRARFPVPEPLLRLAVRSAEDYLAGGFRAEVSEEVRRRFGIAQPKVVSGLVGSGDQFIASTATTEALLKALPSLLCVEMEGAAVAQVAYEHGVPAVVLRAISDSADHSAPKDFPEFVAGIASQLTAGIVARLIAEL